MKKRLFLAAAAVLLAAVLTVSFVPKLRTQTFVALYHEEIERMIQQYQSHDEIDLLLLKGAIYRTVGEALRLLQEGTPRTSGTSPVVTGAITYIRAHLHAGLTVGEIAEALFCSKSKLSSLFQAEVGQSVARYIDDLLMSEAQTMLPTFWRMKYPEVLIPLLML